MNLNKNQKIMIIIGLAAFLLFTQGITTPIPQKTVAPLSMIPLVSTPVLVTITVRDTDTQALLPGVTVVEYLALSNQVAASGVTDGLGKVQMWAYFETPLKYVTSLQGYDSSPVFTTFYASGGSSLTLTMTKMLTPPNTVYASVYCLDNQNHRVANVLVSSSLLTVSSDGDGLAKIPVNIGSNTISFSSANGPQAKYQFVWVPVSFTNYQRVVSASIDSDWTAYVQQGTLNQGSPSVVPGDDGGGDLGWLWQSNLIPGVPNWAICVAVLVLLLVVKG